jgi:hypothetical protein
MTPIPEFRLERKCVSRRAAAAMISKPAEIVAIGVETATKSHDR